LNGRLLDVHRIHLLHASLGLEKFRARFNELLAQVRNDYERDDPKALGIRDLYSYDDDETRTFKLALNYELPYGVVSPILQTIVEETFGEERALVEKLYLSVDDLEASRAAGHDIGIHTHSHPILSRLSETHQRQELSRAAQFFREHLGLRDIHVAYPYGRPGTWNHLTKKLMKGLGFTGGLTMARRVCKPQDLSARWEIPRLDVRDAFDRDNKLQTTAIEMLFTGD
jgi:peptidoglycan/xylan/chitin deacetylase (PgdA/CDA1 family)